MDIPHQAKQAWVGLEHNAEPGDDGERIPARPSIPEASPEDSMVRSPSSASSLPGGPDQGWQTTLEMVTRMLHGMLESNGSGTSSNAANRKSTVPNCVSECLFALDQMRTAVEAEFDQLESSEHSARADLARTRSELRGARESARKAIHESMHDKLTSLPNRACFESRLDRALTLARMRKRMVAVLFIDLDGFKSVNAAHGHLVGDSFLKIVSARLARAVRTDDTASRYGGDEFACLINDTDRSRLSVLASQVHSAISEPVSIGGLILSVQCSIGISTCSGKGPSATDMLCQADQAMYHAKRHGLGFSFHCPSRTIA